MYPYIRHVSGYFCLKQYMTPLNRYPPWGMQSMYLCFPMLILYTKYRSAANWTSQLYPYIWHASGIHDTLKQVSYMRHAEYILVFPYATTWWYYISPGMYSHNKVVINSTLKYMVFHTHMYCSLSLRISYMKHVEYVPVFPSVYTYIPIIGMYITITHAQMMQ